MQDAKGGIFQPAKMRKALAAVVVGKTVGGEGFYCVFHHSGGRKDITQNNPKVVSNEMPWSQRLTMIAEVR